MDQQMIRALAPLDAVVAALGIADTDEITPAEAVAALQAENARLRKLLADALPFVRDAGGDECPEAASASREVAAAIEATLR